MRVCVSPAVPFGFLCIFLPLYIFYKNTAVYPEGVILPSIVRTYPERVNKGVKMQTKAKVRESPLVVPFAFGKRS